MINGTIQVLFIFIFIRCIARPTVIKSNVTYIINYAYNSAYFVCVSLFPHSFFLFFFTISRIDYDVIMMRSYSINRLCINRIDMYDSQPPPPSPPACLDSTIWLYCQPAFICFFLPSRPSFIRFPSPRSRSSLSSFPSLSFSSLPLHFFPPYLSEPFRRSTRFAPPPPSDHTPAFWPNPIVFFYPPSSHSPLLHHASLFCSRPSLASDLSFCFDCGSHSFCLAIVANIYENNSWRFPNQNRPTFTVS